MSQSRYSEPALVRHHNGDEFIRLFRKHSEFMGFCTASREYFKIRKMDVWERAKHGKLVAVQRDDIFKLRRNVMVIL